MTAKMTLVTGAAGKTGRAVLQALARRDAPSRVLVRREQQTSAVLEAGASEVVIGDLNDPECFATALAGCRAVYYICPNVDPNEVEIGRRLIAAARRTRLERLVYHSVLHPQTEAMPHHWRKLRVEELLLTSGLDTTVLQPAVYAQNFAAQRRQVTELGILPVPFPLTTRLRLVDLQDIAEVAAKVLLEPGHYCATYELCGGEAPTQQEIAELLGRLLGKKIEAVAIEIEAWRREARKSGLDPERCDTLVAMFRYYARHGLDGNPNTLRWLLGREPTPLIQALERIVRNWVPTD